MVARHESGLSPGLAPGSHLNPARHLLGHSAPVQRLLVRRPYSLSRICVIMRPSFRKGMKSPVFVKSSQFAMYRCVLPYDAGSSGFLPSLPSLTL